MPAVTAEHAPRGQITRAIVNARIRTGDAHRPWAEAAAQIGDRVAAVGSSAEIRKLVPPGVPIVDARGAELGVDEIPGFDPIRGRV